MEAEGWRTLGLGGKMIKHPGLSKTLLVLALKFSCSRQTLRPGPTQLLTPLVDKGTAFSGVTAGPPLLCDLNCDLNTASVLTALGFSFLDLSTENNIASFIGGVLRRSK